jgi:ABC-2 type transport system permease protein
MKGHPIITDAVATLKVFSRSKMNIVWMVAFPIFMMVVFGAIFSGTGSASYVLYVQDQDGTASSAQFIQAMNQTHALDIKMVGPGVDASQFIKDGSVTSFMIIPQGFESSLKEPNGTADIELRSDGSSTSAKTVMGITDAVANDYNLAKAQGHQYVTIAPTNIVQTNYGYIDYLIPGVMGLIVMNNSVFYINGVWMQGKANGLFKKLVTTPMTKGQWLASKIMVGLVMIAVSITIIMLAGFLLYGMKIAITPMAVAIIVASTALFAGMGLLLTRFSKSAETSNMAIAAITMPMMFLGGTFLPLEQMPPYLQTLASVMPLTYINNGLRDSMIYGNDAAALVCLAGIAVLGIIFFVAGVLLSTGKEDGE